MSSIWYSARDFFVSLTLLLYFTIIGCLKAFLPIGFLPRKSVENEFVLITGSGNGIGRTMAIESFAYTVDLSNRNQIYETAEIVKNEVGHVDILVNNAGIVSGKKLFDCPDELMEKTMAVNSHALFYTTKAFLPKMIENNHGHIVTVASMAGYAGVNAVGFSEALRSELLTLGKDISVTTISPYYINTGMFDADYVVERIMEAILTNSNDLFLPRASNLYLMLPSKAVYILIDYFGLNRNMDHFVGRKKC